VTRRFGLLQDVFPLGGVSNRATQAGFDIELLRERLHARLEVFLSDACFRHTALGFRELFVRNGQGDVVGHPRAKRDIVLRKRVGALRE
jgi:hypothetical protein